MCGAFGTFWFNILAKASVSFVAERPWAMELLGFQPASAHAV